MYKEEKIYTRRTVMVGGENHYFISFKDAAGGIVDIEVGADVYDVVRRFELLDARIARSDRRHIERLGLSGSEIDRRMKREQEPLEKDILVRLCADEVEEAIGKLTVPQRRRFLFYRGAGMKLQEIATVERASISVVHTSIRQAEKKLKKIIKNFQQEG